MEAVEIRSDRDVATDIRNAVKSLNQLIIEAEKQRGLKVELSFGENLALKGAGVPEITNVKITKVL